MQGSRKCKKQQKPQLIRGCRAAFCCSCRLSVSSSEESDSGSGRYASISRLAHAMVQERLDQIIRERKETTQMEETMRRRPRRSSSGKKIGRSSSSSKCIVIVAMEKSSNDPWEDFRESMTEMITVNQIVEPKELRRLLNCYVSMNPEEYQGIILEVFHNEKDKLMAKSSKKNKFDTSSDDVEITPLVAVRKEGRTRLLSISNLSSDNL